MRAGAAFGNGSDCPQRRRASRRRAARLAAAPEKPTPSAGLRGDAAAPAATAIGCAASSTSIAGHVVALTIARATACPPARRRRTRRSPAGQRAAGRLRSLRRARTAARGDARRAWGVPDQPMRPRKSPHDAPASADGASSEVAPQRIDRGERGRSRGLRAQDARPQSHRRQSCARAPATSPVGKPPSGPTSRSSDAGAGTREDSGVRREHDARRPARARAAIRRAARPRACRAARLRPHCSQAATAICRQCARRLSPRAPAEAARCAPSHRLDGRTRARPPCGSRSPSRRSRPRPAPA